MLCKYADEVFFSDVIYCMNEGFKKILITGCVLKFSELHYLQGWFISNGILKPMLSSGSYEEYARIYNRAFLTEYTSDEMREAVENGDAEGFVDRLDQFFMELDKLTQMQWLNVLGNGEFYVYSFC